MNRNVGCNLALSVTGPAELIFSVAAARDQPVGAERLTVSVDGRPAPVAELVDDHGTRLHRVFTDGGQVELTYSATVTGLAEPPLASPLDRLHYLRQSRYCEADTLA
ncbi:MAG: transglutaminase, partial [Propionicimonas sp.]